MRQDEIRKKSSASLSQEWAARFREGDETAFQRLYTSFGDEISRFIRRWIVNPEICEEVVQEVFVRTFRFRNAYDPSRCVLTWMRAIARNAVIDWLRMNSFQFSLQREESATLPSPDLTAEAMLLVKHERRQIRELFRNLTRLQRRVLWLRALRGLSYDEIATELELSLSSVKSALHRARQSLTAAEAPA